MAERQQKAKRKKTTDRPQISVNLPPDVARAFANTRFRRGVTKTRMAMAGLLAFHLFEDVIQRRVVDWAGLLDERRAEWDAAFQWCREEADNWAEVYEEAIVAAIEHEVGIAAGKPAKRASGH